MRYPTGIFTTETTSGQKWGVVQELNGLNRMHLMPLFLGSETILLSNWLIYASLLARGGTSMRYELYYQPAIQGRGEFIRLPLEDAAVEYVDVARDPSYGRPGIMKFLEDPSLEHPPYAPPFLKAGKLLISQTANILQFLGPRLNLVPKSSGNRLWAHQLQLTIADWVYEAGQTHHPIANVLYYEEQTAEAKKRGAHFITHRIPKFLDYFERILKLQQKRRLYFGRAGLVCRSFAVPDDRGVALCFS
jgi:hypothetical protein